jgi:polar amino acid transport system permease protein
MFWEWWQSLFVDMTASSFFNFSFLPKYGEAVIQGVVYTLILSVVSVLMAVLPAFLLATMRLSKNNIIRSIAGAYIAVFRSTPLLVQLMLIYYGVFSWIPVPNFLILGFIDASRFIPGVVALSLNSSAYVAESSVQVFWLLTMVRWKQQDLLAFPKARQ